MGNLVSLTGQTPKRQRPGEVPKDFVVGKRNFGWTEGLYGRRSDPIWTLPEGWSREQIGARQFESLVAAVAQHTFIVRLRLGLKGRGLTLHDFCTNRLGVIAFPGGGKFSTSTIEAAASGNRWLDEKNRAVLETLGFPEFFGLHPYGLVREPHAVTTCVLDGLGVTPVAKARGERKASMSGASGTGESRAMTLEDEVTVVVENRGRLPQLGEILGLTSIDPTLLRLEVKVDRDCVGGQRLPPEANAVAMVAMDQSLRRLLEPLVAHYHATGVLPLPQGLAKVDVDFGVGGGDAGWVEGSIQLDEPFLNASVAEGWYEEVGKPGHALMDGRFVFDIVERNLFGGPAVVAALGLGYEAGLDTNVSLEEWPVVERLEPGIWLFEVGEAKAGQVKLSLARNFVQEEERKLVV